MTISRAYLTKIPNMPSNDLPTVEGASLVRELGFLQASSKTIGVATASSMIPVLTIKHCADGTDELRSAASYLEAKPAVEAFDALVANWPKKYEKYIGQYLWLNHLGDTIAPVFEGRTNILGTPVFMLLGLVSMWKDTTPENMRGVIWTATGPMNFGVRHLPLMLLSLLPDHEYREVLRTFDALGQGFMRYFVDWAQSTDKDNPARDLVKIMAMMKYRFGVYGTSDVIRVLRQALPTG